MIFSRFSLKVRGMVLYFLLVSSVAFGLLSCRSTGETGDRRPRTAVFGDVTTDGAAVDLPDIAPYLRLARAVVDDRNLEDLPAETGPRLRVFVSAFRPGRRIRMASALEADLRSSVIEAARRIRASDSSRIRIKVDVVRSVEPFEPPPASDDSPSPGKKKAKAPRITLKPHEIGAFGILFESPQGGMAYVLPSDIIHHELYKSGKGAGLKYDEVLDLAAERAGVSLEALERWRPYRFRTLSVVEAEPGGDARPLVRGMIPRRERLEVADLLAAVRLGADYLVRSIDSHGRYIYNYKAAFDRESTSYNMLRHCGTTYALLEAYEEFHDPRYLEAATAALDYVKTRLHPRPAWVRRRPEISSFVHMIDEERGEQSKSGGGGLALLAFAKHAALTRDASNLGIMRGLARYLMFMQEEDGRFISYFQYREDRPETQKEVLYYPGEAMLGLMRLYALDPDPRWLATARKGADYVIDVRDASKTEKDLPHDHWLSMALNEIYRRTGHRPYAEHAFKIARAIMNKQILPRDTSATDFVGGFYSIPNSTPAAVRLEAFDADITLARFMGRSEQALLDSARLAALFVESQQFTEERAYFLPDPDRALGGVREGVIKNDIRIDYVQHALSSMLGLARVLRDADYGRTGVPAVIPVDPLPAALDRSTDDSVD